MKKKLKKKNPESEAALFKATKQTSGRMRNGLQVP